MSQIDTIFSINITLIAAAFFIAAMQLCCLIRLLDPFLGSGVLLFNAAYCNVNMKRLHNYLLRSRSDRGSVLFGAFFAGEQFVVFSDLMENFSLYVGGTLVSIVVFSVASAIAISIVFVILRRLPHHWFDEAFILIAFKISPNYDRLFSKILGCYMAVFVVIALSNSFGLIPIAYTVTSYFALPLFVGFLVFGTVLAKIVFVNGIRGLGAFLPKGTNTVIAPLVVVVEILSFVAKFFSLVIRLFANLFAGHLLLKVLTIGVLKMASITSVLGFGGGAVLVLFTAATLILEIIMAGLQAFVFLAISLSYYKNAVAFLDAHN